MRRYVGVVPWRRHATTREEGNVQIRAIQIRTIAITQIFTRRDDRGVRIRMMIREK